MPKGRKAEDGTVPERYSAMQEMIRGGYPKRTEQNILDSELYVGLDIRQDHGARVKGWLVERDIKVLNVAGSRESKAPGIYDRVKGILVEAMGYPDRRDH